MVGLSISAPRPAASPHAATAAALGPELAALLGPAAGASTAASGTSSPQAAGSVEGGGAAAMPGAAPSLAAVRLSSSVDAIAADLFTLLSASGLRALSAKLAALADEADQRTGHRSHSDSLTPGASDAGTASDTGAAQQ
jgi:hypothetical protein